MAYRPRRGLDPQPDAATDSGSDRSTSTSGGALEPQGGSETQGKSRLQGKSDTQDKSEPQGKSDSQGKATPRRAPKGGRVFAGLIVAWIVLILGMIAAAAWMVWVYIGTDQMARNEAKAMIDAYNAYCATNPDSSISPDQVIGVITLSGEDTQRWPIVSDQASDPLNGAVMWYSSTAQPGDLGNTALSAYSITHGAPFADLSKIQVGQSVTITTCQATYRYEIASSADQITVSADDDWVLQAVPGQPGRVPTRSMLTLITSQDKLPSRDRSVAFASLVDPDSES